MTKDLLNEQKRTFQAQAEPLKQINNPLHLNGSFRLLDAFISHSQLVYRSTITSDEQAGSAIQNTDLYFEGTHYLDLPSNFNNPTIRQGREDEHDHLQNKCHFNLNRQSSNLFAIESNGSVYFVVATYLKVINNDLPPLESIIIRQS